MTQLEQFLFGIFDFEVFKDYSGHFKTRATVRDPIILLFVRQIPIILSSSLSGTLPRFGGNSNLKELCQLLTRMALAM